jgi:mRNA-degrading endonuclease toxin of MazEF toxin-antitoxin module
MEPLAIAVSVDELLQMSFQFFLIAVLPTISFLYLSKFVVAEITTTIRAIPVEVRLGSRESMSSPCVANLDNLRTAARQWFDSRAGSLAPSGHNEVKRALGYALGWDELIDLGSK